MKKHITDSIGIVLRSMAGICITISMFLTLKMILGNPSSIPESIREHYPPSYLARHGRENLGYLVLILFVQIHWIGNFRRIQRRIDRYPLIQTLAHKGIPAGFILGAAFGLLWFIAFLELGTVFYPRIELRCILSGVRDLVTLSLSGLVYSLLFPSTSSPEKGITDTIEKPTVIVYIAAGTALFHWSQYMVTFSLVPTRMSGAPALLWLAGLGVWIGAMYYLFADRSKSLLARGAGFFLNLFGGNWILYNLFYNPAVSVPIFDIVLRSFAGILGGFAGLLVYHRVNKE